MPRCGREHRDGAVDGAHLNHLEVPGARLSLGLDLSAGGVTARKEDTTTTTTNTGACTNELKPRKGGQAAIQR